MTHVGSYRRAYSEVERAPSRFSSDYAAWCERAETWHQNNGCHICKEDA